MIIVACILLYFMLWTCLEYSRERERRKFHQQQHRYWRQEAQIMGSSFNDRTHRMDGDEWKDICGY
jgi:hypothetical protein